MKLINVLRKDCIVTGAELKTKDEALKQVARTAKKSELLSNADKEEIYKALKEREKLGSTGFGHGIAIPHCRIESASDFVVGVVTVSEGVEFDAIDDEKVKLIVFIIAPLEESDRHVKLLSAISQTLTKEGVIEETISAKDPEALRENLLRHTRPDINGKDLSNGMMFHIFVQDENIFRDLLEKLAGIETGSISILSTENAGAYLAKMPLFAGFWSDDSEQFSRVIIFVVNKQLANETVRRIETLTGDLHDREDILMTLQEISYTKGSLKTRV